MKYNCCKYGFLDLFYCKNKIRKKYKKVSRKNNSSQKIEFYYTNKVK